MPRPRKNDSLKRASRHGGSRPLPPRPEEELFQIVQRETAPLLLILDCLTDPRNFGACLRSADAAGAHAVIAPKDKSAPLNEIAQHTASGAADSLPVFYVTNLARTLEKLKGHGVWFYGMAEGAPQSLYDCDLRGPVALVMGSEGEGLRRLTREACDFLLRIPMRGSVDCLNVSVAAGVCLFETARQRLSSA